MIKEVNIKQLAKQLMFDYDETQANEIESEFAVFQEHLKILDDISTDGVEEMIYPLDVETSYLRKDVANHFLTTEELFQSSDVVKEDHLVVPKVV